MGRRARRDALHALVPAAHRPDGREARLVYHARTWAAAPSRSSRARTLDPGRARRVLVPRRRPPRDVRGSRLHRLRPDEPGVHRRAQRRPPRSASRRRLRVGLARRSTTRSRCLRSHGARSTRRPNARSRSWAKKTSAASTATCGAEQEYFLVDEAVLRGPPRPASSLAARSIGAAAAARSGVRRPLLRLHPRAHHGLHERRRGPSSTGWACPSPRGTTRWRPASTSSRPSSRTRTSPPTTSSS